MGEFLYYLPGVRANIDKAFEASGLRDRLDAFPHTAWDTGPGDKSGIVISQSGHRHIYKADKQTWAGPFNDRYWIGFQNDDRPGPADLRRPQQVDGTEVLLLDDASWLIPSWRLAPMALTMGTDGAVSQKPLPVGVRLQARFDQIRARFEDRDTEIVFDWAELLRIIADVLSINYRMGTDPAQELSMLELVSTGNYETLVNAVLDMEFLKTLAAEAGTKKNGQD